MFLINGKEQQWLAANDRATQFGDGCFTTARILDGQIQFLDAHLQRLRLACKRLRIPYLDWDMLAQEMAHLAKEKEEGVVKVILSRGTGGRGYSAAGCDTPTRIVSLSASPAHYARWRQEGVTLALSDIRLGRNPMLAGIKHLNRLEQVLIRTGLEQTSADEALVLDSEGWLVECCAANIFWRQGSKVFTPRVDQAGVDGIMRQYCLRQLKTSAFEVVEVNARHDVLMLADEVIICNALMPVVPVRQWAEKHWSARDLYHFLAPLCERINPS
ncbi:aminodeoxychorismate lyase [Kosakonia sacchari]|uniref:aminodeoxychorismate lyase n=1 Tax=Kosakonia sacchari TaxID=1158459 RepID=UPI002ACDC9A7|nr:aminodeoxychorismate lyase [Kosakonia sacchari]MDZ7321339.1 aminodeoxychorismate lyase [Kosakonia sacchari]